MNRLALGYTDNTMMPAMVLCAGFGTRLRPLTNFFPKPLLPIGDKPAFLHIVEHLRGHGCGPIALNTHHHAGAFEHVVPSDVAALRERTILGTAGGVANAAAALGRGDVLVWNGDMQLNPDLRELATVHRSAPEPVVATLLVAARPRGEGTVGVDADDHIVRLRGEVFGPEARGADYLGIMILSQAARTQLPSEGCLVGDVVLPSLRDGWRARVCWHDSGWVDIGTPAHFLLANLAWLRSRGCRSWCAPKASIAPSVHLVDTIVAGGDVLGQGELRACVVLPQGRLYAPSEHCIGLPDGNFVRVPVDPALSW